MWRTRRGRRPAATRRGREVAAGAERPPAELEPRAARGTAYLAATSAIDYVDQLAAAAAQRLPHRARRLRGRLSGSALRRRPNTCPVGGRADQASLRPAGVVAECRACGDHDSPDAQPEFAPPAGQVVAAQTGAVAALRGGKPSIDMSAARRSVDVAHSLLSRNRRHRRASRSYPIEKKRRLARFGLCRRVGSGFHTLTTTAHPRECEQLSAEAAPPQDTNRPPAAVAPLAVGRCHGRVEPQAARGDFAQPGCAISSSWPRATRLRL